MNEREPPIALGVHPDLLPARPDLKGRAAQRRLALSPSPRSLCYANEER